MFLQEAIRKGRRFKRRDWMFWCLSIETDANRVVANKDDGYLRILKAEDILAPDWEALEQPEQDFPSLNKVYTKIEFITNDVYDVAVSMEGNKKFYYKWSKLNEAIKELNECRRLLRDIIQNNR